MLSKTDKTALKRISLLQENQSLAELCRKVGLNYRAVQKSYQRRSLPDPQALVKISAYFHIDLKWLITGKSSPMMPAIARRVKSFRKQKRWSFENLRENLFPGAQTHLARILELFEKGLVAIADDLLWDMVEKLDVSAFEHKPVTAQAPELKIFQTSSTHETPQIRDEDYVSIPLTTSAIAAGQPIIPENNIEDYVLLHVRAAGKRKNLVASRVDGESMEPMLHSGDIVVVDRDDRKLVKNKMYAIFYEEGLTAKYVERQKDLLILRPINPNAQVQVVNLNENPDPVVGRIIGAWKEF